MWYTYRLSLYGYGMYNVFKPDGEMLLGMVTLPTARVVTQELNSLIESISTI